MYTTVTTHVWTRNYSVPLDPSQYVESTLNEVLKQNRVEQAQKRAVAQRNQGPNYKSTCSKSPGVRSGSPPVALGRKIWNEVFQGEEFELPDTEFMNHLQELLPDEQVSQLITDIWDSLNIKETEFCKADHETA